MSTTAAPRTAPDHPAAPPAARKAFGHTFWMLNVIEMFERLAYFGVRAVVPLYIMQAAEPGGLHLTAVHKGWIYMWWAILQSWLPMFTGGIADRYGYKRVLFFAISANCGGYLMMALLPSYYGFFAGILLLASGTAFFKPALQGSLAQNLTKANSSLGWGIFYWVVNVGAVMAPILATIILGKPHSAEGWRNLFLASAAYTAINLLVLLTFRDVPSGAEKTLSLAQVFARTVENIWPYWFRGGRLHPQRGPLGIVSVALGLTLFILYEQIAGWTPWPDQPWMFSLSGAALFLVGALLATWLAGGQFQWQLRLPAFLLILACFWMMMYQLWDLHPNFITDWVDSSSVAACAPAAWREYGDRGLIQVPQQILLNLNAALIVLLIVPIAWAASKMRTLSAMLVGMSVATIGILVAGLTANGWILLLGIVFFSLGEMWTGPKKNEYLGLIAPPGKKGLYLGYVNIPVGVGVGLGSLIAGVVYDRWGEKATLALKELGARPELIAPAISAVDWSDSLDKLPALLGLERDQAFAAACAQLGQEPAAVAQRLRGDYQYDRGQITNLACLYVAAEHPDYRDKVRARFAAELAKPPPRPLAGAQPPRRPETQPGASETQPGVTETQPAPAAAVRRAEQIRAGTLGVVEAGLARHVLLVPGWAGFKRAEAFDLLRALVNQERPPADPLDDGRLITMLWERYGNDPQVLDNLALEYLAQGTPLLAQAVARALHDEPLRNPVTDIPKRFGIDRNKSFEALSAALGADEAALAAALASYSTAGDAQNRLYTYLVTLPHVRFAAVARRDWSRDLPLLREMIETSTPAKEIAERGLARRTSGQRLFGAVARLFGQREPTDFHARLAENQTLIQDALAAKDWSAHPEQARRLLQLGAFEAQARAAAEVNRAGLDVTRLLWDKYAPQYWVWIPFAAIGVLATIALGIFGQMAKRWKDMNA